MAILIYNSTTVDIQSTLSSKELHTLTSTQITYCILTISLEIFTPKFTDSRFQQKHPVLRNHKDHERMLQYTASSEF